MARDVRKLDVITEMRARNRMFSNPSKFVVVKSEEFYSKKPIFEGVTNGLPVLSREKKVEAPKTEDKVEKDPEDRTLKDLLHDLNQEEEEPKPKDESVQDGSGSEGDSRVGAKRGRDEEPSDDTPSVTSGGSGDDGTSGSADPDGNDSKRARTSEGGGQEEAQAAKTEEGGTGCGGEPNSEKEAQA
jgi:hypothetical protein